MEGLGRYISIIITYDASGEAENSNESNMSDIDITESVPL